jgi:flagellar biosynthetic protein FliR
MFEFPDQWLELVPRFLLIFIRLSALMVVLPVLSYPVVPVRIRIALSLVLSMILTPVVDWAYPMVESLLELAVLVIREVLIGLIIGFGAKVIFEGINMAGGFIGRQMGIGIANVMDPTSRQQIPVVSHFWALVMITYFLAIDGHHLLVETMFRNFSKIPLGGGEFPPALGTTIVRSVSHAFFIALKLGLPAMIFLLLVDTAISFTARVMPQMNIFLVTLPLKIGTGIFVLITSLNIFQVVFDSIYGDIVHYLGQIIMGLQGV